MAAKAIGETGEARLAPCLAAPSAASAKTATESSMIEKPTFDLDGGGNVISHPLTGWWIGVAFGMAALLQFRYARSESEIAAPQRMQLSLTPAQCRQLAADLLRSAERMEQSRPAGSPS